MITQFRFALKDIWKRPVIFLFFYLKLIIAMYFLYFNLGWIMDITDYYFQARKMFAQDITFFSPDFESLSRRRVTRPAWELLHETFDNNRTGYSVIQSMELADYPNQDLVVGLGAFAEVFGLNAASSDNQDITVLIGNRVELLDVGDTIEFGELESVSLQVSGRLPSRSSYVRTGAAISLDSSIIILTDMKTMAEPYFEIYDYWNQIITNTALLEPTGTDLVEFVTTMRDETNIILNPFNQQFFAEQHYQGIFYGGLLYVVFFGALLLFILFGIIANILQLMDSNIREYAIHLLYGARRRHLYARIIIYLILLVTPPIIITAHRFWVLQPPFPLPSLPLILSLILSFTLLLASVPIIKLSRSDLISYLRSDG